MESQIAILIQLTAVVVSTVTSITVTTLTLFFRHRNAKKEMKHSRLLEAYELGLQLFAPAPEGLLAMAEKQYACDLVQLNALANAYCDKKLATAINDFTCQYLRSYKILTCNLLIKEDAWHSTDLFEDNEGKPIKSEHSLINEYGEQKYKREVESIQHAFFADMSGLVKKQSELAEMILAKLAKL